MRELSVSDVSRARLVSLLLNDRSLGSAGEIVSWFGAMQAQDLASGKWSLGVRIPGSTEVDIDAAIERGEILRTWPMRGTIHFVPPIDARWMLELTGVKALDGAAKRREYLGLDFATVDRAASVLESALAGGGRLTRADVVAKLTDSGILTAGQHSYHLLWYVSQIGLTCIGPNVGKEQTFVLLDDWAPRQRQLDRDDALVELAFRYFRSHGPTSTKDFAGWTGLSMLDAKKAVADNHDRLYMAQFRGQSVFMTTELADAIDDGVTASRQPGLALPGFDEFVLGYKDRTVHIANEHKNHIIPGGNGIFRSTFSVDGTVIATWKRSVKKSRVVIELMPFDPLSAKQLRDAQQAFKPYGEYLGLPVTVQVSPP